MSSVLCSFASGDPQQHNLRTYIQALAVQKIFHPYVYVWQVGSISILTLWDVLDLVIIRGQHIWPSLFLPRLLLFLIIGVGLFRWFLARHEKL